ncbi:SDR family oxidoreductase [Streptomyces sp. TS71-3]|uniref:SDR family NAD(P)-dependent oxidoreductase n=1 Tax=Streptomyces sp. TS71-3 TaxID=2733862 RepID=UPI001AFF65D9|nr:SDR family oxidoreductase [Streptomyces sp. TS71-3]GHJ37470.1 oxidoreductase [Streptomyces sp. TS71-3]
MTDRATGTAVVTGASGGMGAVFADRLAARGHDLILVARNRPKLETLAGELAEQTGRRVEVLAADLADRAQSVVVEDRLRSDESIELLVNNAGLSGFSPLTGADPDAAAEMIAVNTTAFTRLAIAALAGLTRRGRGAIINLSSALALNIYPVSAVYSGTKSYVIAFTQALQQELGDGPVRAQLAVPGGVDTAFWDGSGIELESLSADAVMSPEDAVDAVLAGFDAGEPVTIPSMPDITDWTSFDQARKDLIPKLSRAHPADRYTP